VIVNERIVSYINSLDHGNTPFLDQLEIKALEERVPIIRHEMQTFLKFILTLKKPHHILEVGTAVGFSALLMAEYAPEDTKITTIEKYEKRIPIAKENFAKAGREEQITLLEGDALVILKELLQTKKSGYDLIFMDAAKGQYPGLLPDLLELLEPEGLLISDNVLQEGDIIESRFAVTRRNRTIHARMRDYLYMLMNHDQLTTTILPVGDGITVSVKSKKGKKYDD